MEGADHDDHDRHHHHHQPASAENPEEAAAAVVVVTTTTSSEGPVRSYDCTFCKRGFSNAQALGGHMNIHRKDKAKLKQQSTAAASSNIINTASTATHDHHHQNIHNQQPYFRRQFSSSPVEVQPPSMEAVKAERAWNILGGDHHQENKSTTEEKQLSLFVEIPLMISDHQDHQKHERVSSSSSSSSGPFSELDLELRLGPEPQESPSATGTKKFF